MTILAAVSFFFAGAISVMALGAAFSDKPGARMFTLPFWLCSAVFVTLGAWLSL